MFFLFEYTTCTENGFPESIAVEGLAMFKALSMGIREEVYSFVNPEHTAQFRNFPIAEKLDEDFSTALEKCDKALIVAPESENLLYILTEQVEKAHVENLGISSRAVRTCSDKYETLRRVKGLRTPGTEVFNGKTSLDFPLVAKPRVGEGGEGIFFIRNEEELGRVPENYIVQEYIPGQAASASLFSSDNKTELVSLQTQITEGFRYMGADIPFEIENSEELIEASYGIEGLKGFFGMDFIVNNGEIVLLEINPRVTTPVIAFEAAYGITFYDILNGKLPERTVRTRIRKIDGKAENPFISTGDYSIVIR
ncbi:MAG TPA: ATP-grasp domain-containing protein [Euryarchaeota archaeon]|nr:carbamoyl phosphate synthase-like protein [archaeon BMS3Bbin15]HDL15305.1 ATP-grasp domain-containing protein [Euryarchaeota archaeon]